MPVISHTDRIYQLAKQRADERKVNLPKPTDPVGAIVSSLKHTIDEGIRPNIENVATAAGEITNLAGVGYIPGLSTPEQLERQERGEEDVRPKWEQALSATTKTVGGVAGTALDVVFAAPVAGFEALNEVAAGKEPGFFTDVLSLANVTFEFLGGLGDAPGERSEQRQRAESFAGKWAGWVRDPFWEKVGGASVTSEMDTVWRYIVEDVLDQTLPELIIVKGPKLTKKTGEALISPKKTLQKIRSSVPSVKAKGVPEGIKNANVSPAERVRMYIEGEKRIPQTERTRMLNEIEEIVRRDDLKALEEFEVRSPQMYKEYIKIDRQRLNFTEKFKELFEKTRKGESITLGDKKYLVESFEKQFGREPSTVPAVNDLVSKVRSSALKVDMYEAVMQEVVASTMSHPKFVEAMKLDRTTLKPKQPKSFEEKGKFAQLEGAEKFPKQPTAEGAREKLEQKAIKDARRELESGPGELFINNEAKTLGKFKKTIPELDTMDLPSALKFAEKKLQTSPSATLQEFVDRYKNFDSRVDEAYQGKRGADEVFSDIIQRSQEIRAGERTRDGKLKVETEELTKREEKILKDVAKKAETVEGRGEIQLRQPSPPKEIDILVEQVPKDKIPFGDEVVGKFFKEDKNPIGLYDEYFAEPRRVIADKVLEKSLGEEVVKLDREWQNEQGRVVNEMHDLQNEVLARYKGETGLKEKLTMQKRMEFLAEESRKIFEAIEDPKLREGLSKENQKTVRDFVEEFDAQRIILKDHHASMIQYRNRKISDMKDSILDLEVWLEEHSGRTHETVARRVDAQIQHHKDVIKIREAKNKESESIINRLAEKNEQYIPHIINPHMRLWVERHFPEVVDAASKAMLFRDNNFLKIRKDFPFYQKDAFTAMALYKREAKRQLTLDKLAEDMIDSAASQGHIKGTVKGAFLRKFLDQKFFEKRPGRETVEPTAKVAYDALYKLTGKADEGLSALMKKDMSTLSDLLKREIILTKEQVEFIKKHAKDQGKIDIKGDVLKLNMLEPNINAVDAFITNIKNLGYASTIGLNPRTTMLNLVTQPVVGLSHSGLGPLEGMKAQVEAYKFAFKSWKPGKEGQKFRDKIEDSGLAPSNRQLFNPERPFTLNRERFAGTMLMNMKFSEYVARTVTAHVGYKAYKKGLITKEQAGEIITIDGTKLAKGWSDKFNFEYTAATMPLWTDTMFGRAVMFLGSFGLKNTDLHIKLAKEAKFTEWLGESEKIFKRKDVGTPEKMKLIIEEYNKNHARLGLAKEAVYGLSAAMVLGQIFDIDLDEFTTKGMGFGISNPITNLFLGTGGWNQDVTSKIKPFIPGRGAVRSVDKMLGTDVLSNYRDFGNVPQISDLIK